MRFNYRSPDEFKGVTKINGPVVIIVSGAEAKSGKFAANLPAPLRERTQKFLARREDGLKAGERQVIQGIEKNEDDFWISVLPEKKETFFLLEHARDTLKQALASNVKTITLVIVEEGFSEAVSDTFGSAAATRVFLMPAYGKCAEKRKPYQLREITLVAPTRAAVDMLERGFALGEGTNLARELATLPPNILDTAGYGRRIREICREHHLALRFYSNRELKRMGAGAFTAVDQANPDSKGGIYEITYSPKSAKNRKSINLVGKGLCFDTGGYDVKIQSGMRGMKGDMQGSSVALATLVAAATLKLPLRMKAFLGVTENHLSPLGFKADDVVTALNGTTIEIVNTDAEGRMVLADTLTLASRENPECVIDFATLTGSAVRSLGTKYSAGFTNRKELHAPIIEAGERSGERVWTFPLDSTYFRALESSVADTVQCTKGPGPDHIYAACFLSKFLKEGTPWVHVDLAASENDGGLAHVDSLFTGFGVRWAHEFLKRYI